ncbi:MAG: Fic family protein [Candidatus Omnitrophica bacterium]|nr:Fic family protein [Candidatus Omnitrophota bacterium]
MGDKTSSYSTRSGKWLKQGTPDERYLVFSPHPLPPSPAIHFDHKLQDLQERANRALGRLDGISSFLPDPDLFIYSYVRKEAVLSSQIEGTQSSLSDLLLFEMEETPGALKTDVKEVSNYVGAMQHGLQRLNKGFPLSLRLIKEIHEELLSKVRGGDKEPGEFRRTQNWIGGTRPGNALYVPPPPQEVMPAMGALEKFFHGEPEKFPTLAKAGLVHAQFESIHPFLDGNGRLGRLLITFILCAEKALSEPLLYLSLYFKEHRKVYYEKLQLIRTEGDWEGWLDFFFSGVEAVATEAEQTAQKLFLMFEEHRIKIQKIGKAASTALRVQEFLKKHAIISLPVATKELELSFPAVNKAMVNLEKLGLVKEFTGKQRHRLFSYEPYLKVLTQGTERVE